MTVDSGWHAVGPTMTTDARVRGTGRTGEWSRGDGTHYDGLRTKTWSL